MEERVQKPKIQLTGFKSAEKEALVELLFKLDCIFIDCEKYDDCSHLIAKKVCKSEKWLAACAAGKWVLTKDYIIDSVKCGRWLNEATYEWGYKLENDSQLSSRMNSAPKRWREKLTFHGFPGAFHTWKVMILIKAGDKRRDAFERVLLAGKATICDHQNKDEGITHVFTNNTFAGKRQKSLFSAPYYPVRYLGDFLLENLFESGVEDAHSSQILSENRKPEGQEGVLDANIDEMKNALWKRLCLAQAIHQKYVVLLGEQEEICEVKHTDNLKISMNRIEGLLESHFFIEGIEELNFLLPHFVPPVYLLQTLLEHMLQGNIDINYSCRFFDIFYSLLHLHSPWKSVSMLKYFLEVLQCPVCKKGTWSFLKSLVGSCLGDKDVCHPLSLQEMQFTERRGVQVALLKYIVDVIQAETQYLSRRLGEQTGSRHLEVMPDAVLQNIFWPHNKAYIFFTKPMNILVDLVIRSHREKYRAEDALKHEISYLLNGILGSAVEYWIILGLLLDKHMIHHVSDILANYISILCDDFSLEEFESLICSIPSPWLQMFVSDAAFRTLCLKHSLRVSPDPLSLQKLICSYLPALGEVGMSDVRHTQYVKPRRRKARTRPGPQSRRAPPKLNDDRLSKVQVLLDLPELDHERGDVQTTMNLRRKLQNILIPKENLHGMGLLKPCKQNTRGETALHTACQHNKVEKLAVLLSWPGADINVKDYAGWTPLHEACNHGNTECVQEILQRCPEADLLSQVDGVTPLHDALSNGHMEIGKLLLQYGGPVLLQQRDLEGKLPLDYIASPELKKELFSILQLPETVEEFNARLEKALLIQPIEFGSFLLCRILLNLCSVYDLSSNIASSKAPSQDLAALTSVSTKKSVKKHGYYMDRLVEQYVCDLQTLQTLPELLTEIPESLVQCGGFHTRTLLAVLNTMKLHSSMAAN